ncbi:uncharacterized protein LOC141859339 [Acropora palmata]|uniref:uncharacterized protein LOC141859339 n=1 Tax=Acropora palmata TaxID=6131 RepID=UPI003D9FBF73
MEQANLEETLTTQQKHPEEISKSCKEPNIEECKQRYSSSQIYMVSSIWVTKFMKVNCQRLERLISACCKILRTDRNRFCKAYFLRQHSTEQRHLNENYCACEGRSSQANLSLTSVMAPKLNEKHDGVSRQANEHSGMLSTKLLPPRAVMFK